MGGIQASALFEALADLRLEVKVTMAVPILISGI